MTKKSVSDEIPRRSSTTISSAFLFAAYSAQRVAMRSGVRADSLAVEAVVLNEFSDGFWNQITDGSAVRNALSYFCRRNIDPPREICVGMWDGGFRAMEDDELHQPAQIFEAMPSVQLGGIVIADEVKELRVRVARPQRFDGIDGKARPFPAEFAVVHGESGLSGDGEFQHLAAQVGRRGRAFEFVRRNAGGNEDHTVELQTLDRITRQDEMAMVHRVEGSPVKGKSASGFGHGRRGV